MGSSFPFNEHPRREQMNSEHPWLRVTEVYLLSSGQFRAGAPATQAALLPADSGIQPLSVCGSAFPLASAPSWGRRRHTGFLKALAGQRHVQHPLTSHQRAPLADPPVRGGWAGRCSPLPMTALPHGRGGIYFERQLAISTISGWLHLILQVFREMLPPPGSLP